MSLVEHVGISEYPAEVLVADPSFPAQSESPQFDHWHIAGLVEDIRQGDEFAWREIMDTFVPMMERKARAIGLQPEDAVDVAQTTLVQLSKNIHTLEQPERLAGWLSISAKRNAIRFLETAYRTVSMDSPDFSWRHDTIPDQTLADPSEQVIFTEVAEARAFLFDIPPTSRKSWRGFLDLLISDEDLSYTEICKEADMPIGSIGPARQRLIAHLRARAEEQGITYDDVSV